MDKSLYSKLSVLGFRRSGNHVYRPHCSQCNACIPARIPVKQFNPSRGQRRVWQRNRDLIARPPIRQTFAEPINATQGSLELLPGSSIRAMAIYVRNGRSRSTATDEL